MLMVGAFTSSVSESSGPCPKKNPGFALVETRDVASF
jgi:hypothetical protein